MLFSDIIATFELIENTKARNEITQLIAELFKQANSEEAAIVCYLSLGQLWPPFVNKQLAIGEKIALQAVAALTGRSEKEIAQMAKKQGDVGLVCQQYEWQPVGNPLTIIQVFQKLIEIAEIQGSGAIDLKIVKLVELLSAHDAVAAKYIIRIILAKLRLGFSDMTLLDALSVAMTGDKKGREIIENAYNLCADIGMIARNAKQYGLAYVAQQQIVVGVPIIPAAAERLPTAQAIFDKLGPCVAQPKLDGFRVQVHINKTDAAPRLSFFSRNLKDMSGMFPDLEAELLKVPVTSIIFEGEAIVFDQNTKQFLPFQDTVKRKRKYDIDLIAQEYPLKFFIFDLLFLNGESMLSYSHQMRRQKLQEVCTNYASDLIQIIDEHPVSDAKALESYFHQMIDVGLEGIVVKKPAAMYRPGKRDFNWIKLKRQEEGHLEDTIDCVVLGYYKGEGKRAAFGIGAFLVGIYNKESDCFQTIAKIGTGLTDQEWCQLKEKADLVLVNEQPHNVVCASSLMPDVWVAPEIVCIVRADEITVSPVHTAGKTIDTLGFALRFPRIMGYRNDKSSFNATTDQEIKRFYEDQFRR
ncbi:ATP-dependent DNA ligase [bacterium]|nr:MAG: ATP-dependent DNA ligase [bacterium]QQR61909.1 MAG: ATP-dependent DNA ligase [bacterium]QQR62504.1 MAG: ATP-dependent DNA ligase [bacterium]